MTITSYISVIDANTYFTTRLDTDSWDRSSSAIKLKALYAASRVIDRLNYIDEKTVSTQEHQFPRSGDTVVPDDILIACCEIAIKLLEGIDPDVEFENLQQLSQVYADVRTTYDRTQIPENILYGIPSPTAWRYLKPYVRDSQEVDLSRGN